MDSNQNTEIETRTLLIDDKEVKEILLDIGFEKNNSITQTDVMYDFPDGRLFKSGQKIRVRSQDRRATLTYKGKFQGDVNASRRTEIDICLQKQDLNNIDMLLSSLGYPMLFKVVKKRTTFTKGSIQATLDEWPIIGKMFEIEGTEIDINNLIEEHFSKYEFKNYRLKELFENHIEKTGKPLNTLIAEYQQKTGLQLGNLEILLS